MFIHIKRFFYLVVLWVWGLVFWTNVNVICDDHCVYENCEVCFTLRNTILDILWQMYSKTRRTFLIGRASAHSNLYIYHFLCYISHFLFIYHEIK